MFFKYICRWLVGLWAQGWHIGKCSVLHLSLLGMTLLLLGVLSDTLLGLITFSFYVYGCRERPVSHKIACGDGWVG